MHNWGRVCSLRSRHLTGPQLADSLMVAIWVSLCHIALLGMSLPLQKTGIVWNQELRMCIAVIACKQMLLKYSLESCFIVLLVVKNCTGVPFLNFDATWFHTSLVWNKLVSNKEWFHRQSNGFVNRLWSLIPGIQHSLGSIRGVLETQ